MESHPSPDESETSHRRRRRSGHDRHPYGRAFVAVLWVVLQVGDLPLAWLAFRTADPSPQLQVPVIVCMLWTTALFVALWMKQIWARYATALFLTGWACWWGYKVMTIVGSLKRLESPLLKEYITLLVVAAVLYLFVAIVLLRSKNIRYLTDPTAGWKPRQF